MDIDVQYVRPFEVMSRASPHAEPPVPLLGVALEAAMDSARQCNKPEFQLHDARRSVSRDLRDDSVDAAKLLVVAIDDLLVEQFAHDVHISCRGA